jgi:tRNA-dihydrouridine synthase 3
MLIRRKVKFFVYGFDSRCKFSHSVKDYLEQKESDIGDVCPVFEAIGVCKDGWRCRWLRGHIQKAEDGDEGAVDGWKLVLDTEAKSPKIQADE